MKKFNLFAYATLAGLALSFAACTDDDPEISKPGPQIDRGEKCRIESFVLNLPEGETLSGDVYDYDKSIDLAYTTPQLEAMKTATATVKLSEGATITPDPSVAADYTQPISFTVTGADGKTTRIYTTKPVEKVVVSYTKIGALAEKTATQMDITDHTKYLQIGVSGDKIVIGTKVFDGKTLAAAGNLNMTGYDGLQVTSLANDEAGHLIASLTADGTSGSAPVTYACWKNGCDQPAETILGPSDSAIAAFLSVGGNLVEGKALITALGARVATGPSFCWGFADGVRGDYYNLLTGQPSNDGSWSQMVSACSGEVSGTWFMWDAVAGGHNVLTWEGWDGTSSLNLKQIPGAAPNGPNNWGNYTKGSIRAFMFNEKAYAAVFTTGWPCTYVSIVDSNGEFLLNLAEATLNYAISDANPYRPVGTFVYNEKENCGYVYVLVPGHAVKSWKLEITYD